MENEKELWIPLIGLEGLVEISSFGNFKRLARRGLPELIYVNNNEVINIIVEGKRVSSTIRILVGNHFLPNVNSYKHIIHKNKDTLDYRVNNLEWSKYKQFSVDLKNRIGEVYKMKSGYSCEIIDYFNADNCTVKFEDGIILKNIRYRIVKEGSVRNPNFPDNYGVGYIGVGSYNSKEHKIAFNVWRGVLQRCNSVKHHLKYPSYIGCEIDSRWHNFQNFSKWYYENYNPETMQGWQLDKDFLFKGNKLYSPETCCLLPKEINCIKLFSKNISKLSTGVCEVKGVFVAKIDKYNKKYHLGSFKTHLEAFRAYKIAKEKYVYEIGDFYKEEIDIRVYKLLINYKVQIDEFKFKPTITTY